ncbi:MAG TPA: tetratricopeptide repeat protein, partial [Deltaproteobacteria bacterium]|nr:tetratricopeptide repeat protein [Deltaproteobacteria bacterium]
CAQRGDYESAVLHLQEALRLQPGNYNVQASLQEALATKQKVEEGFARVGAALQADPENPVLLFQMAGLHRAKGDIGNAVSLYERALAIRPAFPQALQGLAVAHTAGGDYDSALDTLKRLIALNPGNPEPYYNTACVHALRGDAKEAVAWLRKAVEKGFSDWNLIETDDDLAGIRASREFQDFAKGR